MSTTLTHAERLFEIYYQCRVPQAFGLSQMEKMYVGTRGTGNSKKDREQAMEWTVRQYSIGQMADLWADGCKIELSKPADAVPIYQAITDYLSEVKGKVQRTFHTDIVPAEDLQKLDNFAVFIFRIVREVDSTFHLRAKAQPSLHHLVKRRNIRNRKYVAQAEANLEKDKEGKVVLSEHKPITDDIIHTVMTRGIYKKE